MVSVRFWHAFFDPGLGFGMLFNLGFGLGFGMLFDLGLGFGMLFCPWVRFRHAF